MSEHHRLVALVKHVRDRHFGGVQARLAEALGISSSRLGRLLAGQESLNVRNCLKLAQLSGRSPREILTVAGKGEIAGLLDDLYGAPSARPSASDRSLLQRWHQLRPESRQTLQGLLDELVSGRRQRGRPRAASSRAS